MTHASHPSATLPLLRIADLRIAEQQAQQLLPAGELMHRAGQAAAIVVRQKIPSRASHVWVLAGPGNNGGDGFVLATVLRTAGYKVTLSLCQSATDTARPSDALAAQQAWYAAGGITQNDFSWDTRAEMPDLIVDALFGIGLSRSISGQAADWIATANACPCQKLALDIPSGLSADTGQIIGGPAAPVFQADHTTTFIAGKPGLYTATGVEVSGCVSIHDLGVILHTPSGQLNQPGLFSAQLPRRMRNTHKGLFGNLVVIGGQNGMTGALMLAGHMGLLAGAGRVFAMPLDPHTQSNPVLPELMFRPCDVSSHNSLAALRPSCLVIGPGMGTGPEALQVLQHGLSSNTPLVLDADALNLLAEDAASQQRVLHRTASTLLTPHPLEAARLLQTDIQQIQSDRVSAALALAQRYRASVVLKGAGSVLANFEGAWCINPSGNALLSLPGSGDVLSGLIGSLIAQGMPTENALYAGVWLHGSAADALLQGFPGQLGLTASELAHQIREQINRLIASSN